MGPYNFGNKSRKELATLDPRLQEILNLAIAYIDFSVLEGYRGRDRQNKLFNENKTKLIWPDGKHNDWPSKAVDISPYPQDWTEDSKGQDRFYVLAGHIIHSAFSLGYLLRWGGDWDGDGDYRDQTFDDLGHFEIIDNEEPHKCVT